MYFFAVMKSNQEQRSIADCFCGIRQLIRSSFWVQASFRKGKRSRKRGKKVASFVSWFVWCVSVNAIKMHFLLWYMLSHIILNAGSRT